MTENTLTRDGDFSLEKLLERTNDFSDIYGNLVMRSLGKNIAGPVLERGVGTVQASEETRDRLRHLIDGVTDKYDHVLFSEGYELITAEMRTVRFWWSDHEDEHLLQRDASMDDHKGSKGGRRFQPSNSYLHSVGNWIFSDCRMDVWESLRVCSVLLQPIIPTCRIFFLLVPFRFNACPIDSVPRGQSESPSLVGIGFASSGGKTYAVQFGAGFPEALQGRTSQVPSVVVPQMIPFPCLLSSRAYLFSHITTPWMILLELY